MNEKIRIRLKAYDHRLLDQSVKEIANAASIGPATKQTNPTSQGRMQA